jgi:hypothetical protein
VVPDSPTKITDSRSSTQKPSAGAAIAACGPEGSSSKQAFDDREARVEQACGVRGVRRA